MDYIEYFMRLDKPSNRAISVAYEVSGNRGTEELKNQIMKDYMFCEDNEFLRNGQFKQRNWLSGS